MLLVLKYQRQIRNSEAYIANIPASKSFNGVQTRCPNVYRLLKK